MVNYKNNYTISLHDNLFDQFHYLKIFDVLLEMKIHPIKNTIKLFYTFYCM
jgi:hypothetical protein